jgi:hypothetical protein
MSGSQGPPPPEQGGVIPPTPVVRTQLEAPMFQSQPGTPGLGKRGTPPGAQGIRGNTAPTAGGGINNGVLSGMDVAIKLQRHYMQAQHGRADPLTDNRFSDKLPIGGRSGLEALFFFVVFTHL